MDNSPFNIVLFMLSLSYLGVVLLKSNMKFYIEVDTAQGLVGNLRNQKSPPGIIGCISSMRRIWCELNRQEQLQATAMVCLMLFSIIDLVLMSGGSRKQKGYDLGEDLGLDID